MWGRETWNWKIQLFSFHLLNEESVDTDFNDHPRSLPLLYEEKNLSRLSLTDATQEQTWINMNKPSLSIVSTPYPRFYLGIIKAIAE